MEYLVVVEKGRSSYGAYVPDLPGCVAAGGTRREVLKLIRDAVKLHIEALRESGQSVPEPTSKSDVIRGRAASHLAGADAWTTKCQAQTSARAPLNSTIGQRVSSESRSILELRVRRPTLALAHEGPRLASTVAERRVAPRPHQRQPSAVSAS